MQEFFKLKLGKMTMEEYEKKFFKLLRCVGYIKEEKVKIQRFLSGLSAFYRDKFSLMSLRLLKRQLGRPNTYMPKSKAKHDRKGGGHGEPG
jgi:hypothetical protein